jgi:hypothetical protein
MVDISRPDDEAQGENSRSTNEKDIGSTSNEVCDNPISQQRTEPGTPNIPCDLMHHNVVEDDVEHIPESPHVPGESIRDTTEEEGTINPVVISNAPLVENPIALRKPVRRTEIPARLKDCVGYKHDVAKFISYDKCSPSFKGFIASLDSTTIPANWEDAIKDPKWKAAMIEEMNALKKNKTWELVELPSGKEAVGCKWVYTVKQNCEGKVERFKARLVAKGYSQTYGINYEETFAPVAKMNTIRTLISCASNLGWNLHQLDVKNAFLHGDLHEEVYMHIPPGFGTAETEGKVLRLHRSLYGLKQSPRAWFDRFRKAIIQMSYKQSMISITLFYKRSGDMLTILIVYVDDIIIT